MKKSLTLLFVCCFLFVAASLQAQMKFGPVAGLNISKMTLKYGGIGFDPKSLIGFHIGGMAEIPLSGNFVLQPEILYSGKGSSYELDFGEEVYELKIAPGFIEVPVFAAYKFDVGSGKLFLKAGPYFAYGISGQVSDDEESYDICYGEGEDCDMKPLDFGLGFGAGFDLNGFIISLQYELGLANLAPIDDSEMKINVFGFSLAYLFGK
jgi:hypothetical protein